MQIINVSNSNEKPMLTTVSMLRRLLRNALRTTKLPSVIQSPDVAEPIHNVHLRCVIRRQRRAEQSHQARRQQGENPDLWCHAHGKEADELFGMRESVDHQPSQRGADEAACQRQSNSLADEQPKDAASREA